MWERFIALKNDKKIKKDIKRNKKIENLRFIKISIIIRIIKSKCKLNNN